jgi:hypothetical protein
VITGSARGAGAGVAGVNQSTSGYGGYFKNDLGTGLYGLGQNAGVKGEAGSGGGAGVYGSNGTTYGYGGYFDGGTGVYATNAGTNSLTPAGEFVVASSPAKVANEEAVYASSGLGDGVQGFTYANSKAGVSGTDVSTDGGYGGYFASQQGTALYAAGNATITGNLTVSGSISAGTKDFRIDDPLDPANEYLIHTSVESPDMLDLYSGNVRTDARGFATVALPRYFQALNGDFRYQLTAVGRDGWNARVGVWQPVARNRFVIRSDRPHVEVSWQVTGVRHDAYANAHRGPAETPKPPADRGRYLYPQGFGKPSRLAIGQ